MKFIINHLYIFLSIIFAVSSQLIIKWQMSGQDLNQYTTIFDKFYFAFTMLLNPFIILSVLFTLLSGLSWMIAMSKFDISYAYPFTTLGFILVLLLSSILFNEVITWQKSLGVFFIITGILITSRSA
jgi:multidrug transporter EmrE-like cation transporter